MTRAQAIGAVTLLLWLTAGPPARAGGDTPLVDGNPDSSAAADGVANSLGVLPSATPAASAIVSGKETGGVDWGGLSRASLRFLTVEHAFRLSTEQGTRRGLKGPFLRNYGRAVGNLHGWGDGDEFYVNYVGHPMEGAVAGFLWTQNDTAYNRVEFGSPPEYWKGRLRAAAFAWAFSTQFEIGAVSEASIGAIQAYAPQQGLVDHVITPSIGMAWMIGEDAVDKYVIKRIEGAIGNRYIRMLARSGLNPARSFANVLQGRVPWSRDTRSGILTYVAGSERAYSSGRRSQVQKTAVSDSSVVPPFELAITFQPNRFWGGENSLTCLGGGATAGFRVAASWQWIADVGGCKVMGLEKDLSGDSLTYLTGPRWVSRGRGPWSAYLQFLAGGTKISEERVYPELEQHLKILAARDKKPPPSRDQYTELAESNGFVVAPGGGLSYNINAALSVRVADLSYRYAWTAPVWGRTYNNGVQWSTGLVLRMGTW